MQREKTSSGGRGGGEIDSQGTSQGVSRDVTSAHVRVNSRVSHVYFLSRQRNLFVYICVDLGCPINSQFRDESARAPLSRGRRRGNTRRITRGFLRATCAISPRCKPTVVASQLSQPHSGLATTRRCGVVPTTERPDASLSLSLTKTPN